MKAALAEKLRAPAGWFGKITTFLKEVRIQIKKIKWPTPAETSRYTLVVIIATLLVALFLGGVDFLFSTLLSKLV